MDLLLYAGIRDYIYARIEYFTEQVLSANLTLALTVILSLLTLWVMIQGFLIVTGRSQEGLKGFLFNIGKAYFIIAVALGVAAGGSFGVRTLTDTLTDGISQIMTGNSDSGSRCLTQQAQAIIGCKIDMNLAATQSMMSVLAGIDTADNDRVENLIDQAKWFAGIGTAGPAVVAGTLLILFRIAMALFIGFAPIFILCLLFKKTAPLFQKWLYYGLATIFSGVMLGVMADISMDLVANISTADAVSKIAQFLTGTQSSGIMQTVTQQLGLGLVLSTLLITVPPMAGMFFNGVMGNFSPYGAFERWNNPNGGGLPPHMDGGRSMTEQRANQVTQQLSQAEDSSPNYQQTQNYWSQHGSTAQAVQPETIKPLNQAERAATNIVPPTGTPTQRRHN